MEASAPIDSYLPDVADLFRDALDGLFELLELSDTVLGALVRRMVDEAVNPVGVPYAAFDSAI